MRALLAVAVCGLLAVTACSDDSKDKASASPAAASSAPVSAPAPAPATSPAPVAPPTSAAPSATPSAGKASSTPPGSTGTQTTAGALQRFEQYLRALGREDLTTACEIAAPAAKKAEGMGMGDCKSSFTGMLKLIPPAQKQALQSATIDAAKVTVQGSAKVEVPAAAVKASVTFTSDDLGDYTLEFMNGNWFITD
ncbi:hypothetical protein [Yinghuangia seranimata]|uniref:hypothetical protein n=1 Tax=Yinghuangia seranimata TaxID=408067 RepID=UPI00248BD73D|nr:hypothetical protein [Yinghuangia seranimata]MDI2125210.1 hypothetical protein [Yinghuangia seranimata]